MLLATAVLHLVNLSASGWANSFYAAAVQAGTKSWKAFFFGCSDMACSITVDKSPLALWPMELSGRIFGFGSWSMLAPQALMAVGTVWLVMASVRRWFGTTAGLLAGGVLALTPVAVLMFRFNNPDAALVLLMTAAAYATLRALEAAFDPGTRRAATGWLVLAGAFVGLGFLAKMLQVLLVVPALALVYLLCAPNPLRRRVFDLLLSGLAMVFAAGWWVAVVSLVPASSRPYIGGSQNNSVIELMLGYNGLGRLNGEETGSVGGMGGGQGGRWGSTGLTRMFGGDIGGQIAWLLPAALVLLVVGLALAGGRPRTDVRRAAFALWGGWLVVTGLTFSLMQGIFHQYYTVALAPAVAALVGMGSAELWQRRGHGWALPLLAVIVGGSAVWSAVLLGRADGWQPWLVPAVLAAAVVAVAGLVVVRFVPRMRTRVALAGVGGAALVSVLAGPAAYSVQTVATPHTGSIVTAGPVVSGGFGPGRPGGRGGFGPGELPPMGQGFPGGANGQGFPGGANGHGFPGGANGQGLPGGANGQGFPGGANGQGGDGDRRLSRRHGRTAGRHGGECAAEGPALEGRRLLHLGGGDGRRAERRGVPAGHRALGDADRWLQRQRPVADPGPVPGLGGPGPDPLLRGRRHGRHGCGHGRRDVDVVADHGLGGGCVHRDDRRRGDGVRPHFAMSARLTW
ncbi:MAG: glycosyltransferase family 39 protein [Kineosporiaceae bacterium]